MSLRLYRVFVQDVGRRGYSGFVQEYASSRAVAVRRAARGDKAFEKKLLAIPESQTHLFPDPETGLLPKGARR